MIDLAIGSPEVGVVDFNMLQAVLHCLAQQLRVLNKPVELREGTAAFPNGLEPAATLNISEYLISSEQSDQPVTAQTPRTPVPENEATTPRPNEESILVVERVKRDSPIGGPSSTEAGGGASLVGGGAGALGGEVGGYPVRGSSLVTNTRFTELENNVNNLKNVVYGIQQPTNEELIEGVRSQTNLKGIQDMWNSLNVNSRLEANENAINKLSSLVGDVIKELPELQNLEDKAAELLQGAGAPGSHGAAGAPGADGAAGASGADGAAGAPGADGAAGVQPREDTQAMKAFLESAEHALGEFLNMDDGDIDAIVQNVKDLRRDLDNLYLVFYKTMDDIGIDPYKSNYTVSGALASAMIEAQRKTADGGATGRKAKFIGQQHMEVDGGGGFTIIGGGFAGADGGGGFAGPGGGGGFAGLAEYTALSNRVMNIDQRLKEWADNIRRQDGTTRDKVDHLQDQVDILLDKMVALEGDISNARRIDFDVSKADDGRRASRTTDHDAGTRAFDGERASRTTDHDAGTRAVDGGRASRTMDYGPGIRAIDEGRASRTTDHDAGTRAVDGGRASRTMDYGPGIRAIDEGRASRITDYGAGARVEDGGRASRTMDHDAGARAEDDGRASRTMDYGPGIRAIDEGRASRITDYGAGARAEDGRRATRTERSTRTPSSPPSLPPDVVNNLQDLNKLFDTVRYMQNEMRDIHDAVVQLANEKEARGHHINTLVEQIELLKVIKMDREDIVDAMADKADLRMLARKVSNDQFEVACDDLAKGIEHAIGKLNMQEAIWQQALDDIQRDIDTKLDKMELTPVKEFFNDKLRQLQKNLKQLASLRREVEAAGTKRKLLRDVNCISCDADVVMKTEATSKSGAKPMHATLSMKPYLTYELDAIRKSQAANMGGKRNLHDWEAIGKQMDQPKTLQKVRSETDKHICNRYCGGSHTLTTPTQRVARTGHFIKQWGPDVLPLSSGYEVGEDGKMYRVVNGQVPGGGPDPPKPKDVVKPVIVSANCRCLEGVPNKK